MIAWTSTELGEVDMGIPAELLPFLADDEGEGCPARSKGPAWAGLQGFPGRYYCTRPEDHDPPHAARGFEPADPKNLGPVLALWIDA